MHGPGKSKHVLGPDLMERPGRCDVSPTAVVTESWAGWPAARTRPAPTCAGLLGRSTTCFASLGITVEHVLTGNACAYSENTWRSTCGDPGIPPPNTALAPDRPKVERLHRTPYVSVISATTHVDIGHPPRIQDRQFPPPYVYPLNSHRK